ncbi:MAG: hypothetical protein R2822_06970 [Spirosomataceae bacterium]
MRLIYKKYPPQGIEIEGLVGLNLLSNQDFYETFTDYSVHIYSNGIFIDTSAQKADEIISSYTGANATGYLQPLADVLTSTFNTGHIHKTSVDSGFHFYIGVSAFSINFGR